MGPRQQVPTFPAADHPGGARQWRQHWRAAALLLGVSAVSFGLWFTGALDLAQLRDRVEAAGPGAPVLFVLVYAALTLLPVPKNVLSAGAGALFGFGAALIVVWVAAMVGAVLAFGLARALDPRALAWVTGRHHERVEQVLHRHGVPAVVALRLLPVAPFTAINYISGMSSLKVRDYVLGTGAGIIPGTGVYVAVGAYGLARPGQLGAAAAALLGLVLLGGLWSRRLRAKGPTAHRGTAHPGTSGRTGTSDPAGKD